MKCATIEVTFKCECSLIVVIFASKTGSSILTNAWYIVIELRHHSANTWKYLYPTGIIASSLMARSHLTLKLPSMHTDVCMQPQAIDPCPTGTWSSSGTEIPLAMIRCPETFGALCRTVVGSDWSISQELPLDQTGGEFYLVSSRVQDSNSACLAERASKLVQKCVLVPSRPEQPV